MDVTLEQSSVAVIWFLEGLQSEYYDIEVKYAALQVKMKILGDGEGYSLIEFCEEADRYVFVAEIWDKKPYSLSMSKMNMIEISYDGCYCSYTSMNCKNKRP